MRMSYLLLCPGGIWFRLLELTRIWLKEKTPTSQAVPAPRSTIGRFDLLSMLIGSSAFVGSMVEVKEICGGPKPAVA
jgi:hypothetical protein